MKRILFVLCVSVLWTGDVPAQEAKPYRPGVGVFFVDVTEAEVAEATWKLNTADSKKTEALQACELMEMVVLQSPPKSEKESASFWAAFAAKAGMAGVKEFDKLQPMNDHAPPVKMWITLEISRLLLLSYRPHVSEPDQVRRVKEEFLRGFRVLQHVQKTLKRNPQWKPVDDELVNSVVIDLKAKAYVNRSSINPLGKNPTSGRDAQTNVLSYDELDDALFGPLPGVKEDRPAFEQLPMPPPPPLKPVGYEEKTEKGIIRQAREWWKEYRSSLEHYVCDRTIRWYDLTNSDEEKLERLDLLTKEAHLPGVLAPFALQEPTTSTVQVIGGKEKYEFQEGDEFNHKYNQGEMMTLVNRVFHKRASKLHWVTNDTLRGHKVHVLGSTTKSLLTFWMPKENGKGAKKGPTFGFHGRLYVQVGSGRVIRYVAYSPIGVKEKHKVQDVAFLIDYGYVDIQGEKTWLPIREVTALYQKDGEFGTTSKLYNYRKFQTETKLTFTD